MGYIIAAIVVIYLLYLLVRYVLAPIAGVLFMITMALSLGYSLFTSLRSLITALVRHRDPYTTYVDKSPAASSGIKRNYFFGPGYHQLAVTVKNAFSLQKKYLETLKNWKDIHTDHSWFVDMWIYIFYGAAVFCTSVLGFTWMGIFSLLLSVVLITGMCGFYVFFMSLWAADRLILAYKAIQSRCPRCKRISVVPTFICPDCGTEHKHLTPGPYGILARKCSCGKRLATTYFSGRSKYTAACPFCASEFAASDARQFGIQLVGGVSAGKTTFLAAFWHEYLERVKRMQGISIKASPENAFAELEYWFKNGGSSATTETNANMYSVIHKYGDNTPVQMTFYDIAGEAFASLASDIQQQQFKYCEGIVFVIDPDANPVHASETVSGFIHEFSGLKGSHSRKTSDVPVAVIITKADLYKGEIGLPRIKSTFASGAQKYADADGNTSLEVIRNGICRGFLENHGFGNAMNLIDAGFNKAQYYPVSAMGHPAAVGQKYEPWGVLEPVVWLLQQQSAVFRDIVSWL